MKVEHQPLRVLHIVGGVMDVGGIEMFLMNYYRHIDRTIIQFDFCIVEEGEGHFDQEIQNLGGIIYNLPSKKKHPLRHVYNLMRILRDYRQLPVHLHLDGMNGFYGLIMLFNKNKIRISHSHSTNHLTEKHLKVLVHNLLKYLNRIVNNIFSSCSADAALWLHGKKNFNNNVVITNAIDFKKFTFDDSVRTTYRNNFGINDELLIGHVGAFHPSKNHSFIIDIAKELLRRNHNFKIILVGHGFMFSMIKDDIFKNSLNSVFVLIGKTEKPESYYHMMDVYIQPSKFEGLGISVVEAQCNGLPVFISKHVPVEVIFNNNVTIINEMNAPQWVDQINSSNLSRTIVVDSKYNVIKASKLLQDFYDYVTKKILPL